MNEFKFKEVDTEGEATLQSVAEAKAFNRWMFEVVAKHIEGSVFEVGSGIGNISELFLQEGYNIMLSDIRNNYCEFLKEKFSAQPGFTGVVKMDAENPDFDSEYSDLLESFDSVFSLNVVEHIKNDQLAIQNAAKLLRPGGKMIVLVPAYQSLYNSIDEGLEHYRRYNSKSLSRLMESAALKVVHSQYFNFMGIPGWFTSGLITKQSTVGKGQMKLYDLGVPVFRIIDRLVFHKIGLSAIAVGQKSTK